MKVKNYITILTLLFYSAICFAQKDSLWILDKYSTRTSVFTKTYIKTSLVITDNNRFRVDESQKDSVTPRQTIYYPSNFVVSPSISFPDNYTRFKNVSNYYNNNSDYSFSRPGTNPNFDPTNPWNTNKIGDALIMGGINTFFSLFNR